MAQTPSAQIGTNSDISIYGEVLKYVLEASIADQQSNLSKPLRPEPPSPDLSEAEALKRKIQLAKYEQERAKIVFDGRDYFSQSAFYHYDRK